MGAGKVASGYRGHLQPRLGRGGKGSAFEIVGPHTVLQLGSARALPGLQGLLGSAQLLLEELKVLEGWCLSWLSTSWLPPSPTSSHAIMSLHCAEQELVTIWVWIGAVSG